MPFEHREIRFSLDEVVDALTVLMIHNGTLPTGGITGLRIIEVDGSIAARIRFGVPRGGKANELVVSAEHMCAALIAACRTSKIPLPRAAEKRLVRAGNSVAMCLDI